MGIKLNDSISSSPARNPGPGQYDLQNKDNIKMLRASKYSIGTSSRGQVVTKAIANVPGPGNYKSSLFDKANSPNFGFGSGTRDKLN